MKKIKICLISFTKALKCVRISSNYGFDEFIWAACAFLFTIWPLICILYEISFRRENAFKRETLAWLAQEKLNISRFQERDKLRI